MDSQKTEAERRAIELTELFVMYCRLHKQTIVWGGVSEQAFREQHKTTDLKELRKELTKRA